MKKMFENHLAKYPSQWLGAGILHPQLSLLELYAGLQWQCTPAVVLFLTHYTG